MMSEPLSDRAVFISYLEMTRARPLDNCTQAHTSEIHVRMCVQLCVSVRKRAYYVQVIGVNDEAS